MLENARIVWGMRIPSQVSAADNQTIPSYIPSVYLLEAETIYV